MPRTSTAILTALVALVAAPICQAQEPAAPILHIQTDKPLYRLGETIWYRVHIAGKATGPLRLSLIDGDGNSLEDRELSGAPESWTGSFFLSPKREGGAHRLVLTQGGRSAHAIPLEVYDLTEAKVKLSLTILARNHRPGEELVAAFRAIDLKGRPVPGAELRYKASFGPIVLEGEAGATDHEGRALIRLPLPDTLQSSGRLSVGIDHKKFLGAASAPVQVSASVARIDVIPEGGAILAGVPQRLGLVARDLDGQPVLCEGRVYDDEGLCVGVFQTDERGYGVASVPYEIVAAAKTERPRGYHLRVDRPIGVSERFPLPAPGKRRYALRIGRSKAGAIIVTVHGAEDAASPKVRLVQGEECIGEATCSLKDGEGAVAFKTPKAFGMAYVLVEHKDRVYLKAPVLFGAAQALKVEVRPRSSKAPRPGETVVLDVTSTRHGRGVPADLALSVYHDGATDKGRLRAPDFYARALFEPYLDGPIADVNDLIDGSPGAAQRREAFVMVRSGCRLPAAGVPADAPGLAGPAFGRWTPPAMKPRPPVSDQDKGSRARPSRLDRVLARAHFTRHARPRSSEPRRFERVSSRKKRMTSPGLGKAAARPPQELSVSRRKLDNRDTLYWSGRVRTDQNGKATLRFRLGDEVGRFVVLAQGTAGGEAISSAQRVRAQSDFAMRFNFPSHLEVGDQFDVMLFAEVRDGSKAPIAIEAVVPPCLEALEDTRLRFDPSKDSARVKMRFRAIAPAEGARFAIVARRGLFREVVERELLVGRADFELKLGKSGSEKRAAKFSCRIPADAVPGSVRLRGSATTSPVAEALEGFESMLREPKGCFEQTTSSNYPNLEILAMMLEKGSDPRLLERAYLYAQSGFERILTFQRPSGGFALWPKSGEPQVRYTAMAVRQLALYARFFDGAGIAQAQRALRWLDKQGEKDHALYAAFAVNDSGMPWRGVRRALKARTDTAYRKALLADALFRWPGELGPKLAARRARLVGQLAAAQRGDGAVASEGAGVMGSQGFGLTVETTALATVIFAEAGDVERADKALRFLAQNSGSWRNGGMTQAMALGIRAVTRAYIPEEATEGVVALRFSATGGGGVKRMADPQRPRPLVWERGLPAGPRDSVRLAISASEDLDFNYHLSVSCRTTSARSSPEAPFSIAVFPPKDFVAIQNPATRRDRYASPSLLDGARFKVQIKAKAGAAPGGQYLALIAVPGGARVAELERVRDSFGCQRAEMHRGRLALYWEAPPIPGVYEVPMDGVVAGNFALAPSVIYPYYAAELRSFSKAGSVKLFSEYDKDAAIAAAAAGRR